MQIHNSRIYWRYSEIKLYYHVSHVHMNHDDVIKWKHFLRYWPFSRGIHRSLTRISDAFFDLAWINGWVNNSEAGDLRRHRDHYDVIVMWYKPHQLYEVPLPEAAMVFDNTSTLNSGNVPLLTLDLIFLGTPY